MFAWLGGWIVAGEAGGPRRLLIAVFVAVSLSTAFLNLDATVLILTPVVLAAIAHLRVDHRLYTLSTAHLVNSASLLMPVSNLTNLLVFHESGLSFTRFTLLMLLPWLAAIAVEWVLLPRVVRRRAANVPAPDLRSPADPAGEAAAPHPSPWVLAVLGATLLGFLLSGPAGIEPLWFAWAGAALLTGPDLARGAVGPGGVIRSLKPGFLLFVLALGLLADLLNRAGLDDAIASALPAGDGLGALLAVAFAAAVLSNLINNLPATLIMAPAVAGLGEGPLLAMLIGVGVGPNLSYLGSVANLLWRRVMVDAGQAPTALEFTKAGLITTPVALILATVLLWAGIGAGI